MLKYWACRSILSLILLCRHPFRIFYIFLCSIFIVVSKNHVQSTVWILEKKIQSGNQEQITQIIESKQPVKHAARPEGKGSSRYISQGLEGHLQDCLFTAACKHFMRIIASTTMYGSKDVLGRIGDDGLGGLGSHTRTLQWLEKVCPMYLCVLVCNKIFYRFI